MTHFRRKVGTSKKITRRKRHRTTPLLRSNMIFGHTGRGVPQTAGGGAIPVIALTDTEMAALMNAARPLVADRARFLKTVVKELARQPAIGEGPIFRVCRDVQRRYLDPSTLGEPHPCAR